MHYVATAAEPWCVHITEGVHVTTVAHHFTSHVHEHERSHLTSLHRLVLQSMLTTDKVVLLVFPSNIMGDRTKPWQAEYVTSGHQLAMCQGIHDLQPQWFPWLYNIMTIMEFHFEEQL